MLMMRDKGRDEDAGTSAKIWSKPVLARLEPGSTKVLLALRKLGRIE